MNLLLIGIVSLALSILVNIFFKRFHLPTIIGYIFTGVFISQAFHLKNNADLAHVAEFGIVFLMFSIGLEFSLEHLKQMKKEVFINGPLQMITTSLVFFVLCRYVVGLGRLESIVICSALALSSTAIVLKVYNENGNIKTLFGRKTLGILLFQDIAVIPILLVIDILAKDNQSLMTLFKETLISGVILFVVLFFIGKIILTKLLELVTKTDSSEIFISSILLVVIGTSFLAHVFGFSYSLGAFVAGMLIAETKFKYQVEADLIPFRDILLGFFFITVGLQIDLGVIQKQLVWILGALVVITIVKAALIFAIVAMSTNKRPAFKTALGLFQVGEFALAIFEIAQMNSLLEPQLYQVLVAIVVMSMIITPFVLKNLSLLSDRFFSEPLVEPVFQEAEMKNHIIVCGYGTLGQHVVLKLKQRKLAYLVIEHDTNLVRLGQERGEPVFFGNAAQKSILESVYAKEASAVIVAIKNEEKLRLLCEILHSIKKDINIVVQVADHNELHLLDDLHINHILNANHVLSEMLVKEVMICDEEARGEPEAGKA